MRWSQYLITLEIRKAQVPLSTTSRVVWSLTDEGGDIGIIKCLNHPTHRPKKLLVINERNELPEVVRAITRLMRDYYGDTVKHLRVLP